MDTSNPHKWNISIRTRITQHMPYTFLRLARTRVGRTLELKACAHPAGVETTFDDQNKTCVQPARKYQLLDMEMVGQNKLVYLRTPRPGVTTFGQEADQNKIV